MTVTLAQVKSALKVDYTEDDAQLNTLRLAAIELVQRRTGLTLSQAAAAMYLPTFADTQFAAVPYVSIQAVTYQDSSNATVTMPSADYWVDRTDVLPVLRFLTSPTIYVGTVVTVSYTAGYSTIPNELAHCIIALAGAWYNNPEATQPITMSVVPMSVEYILESISVRGLMR
jgi:uncharacterized phiE125 gp8 family phage protein